MTSLLIGQKRSLKATLSDDAVFNSTQTKLNVQDIVVNGQQKRDTVANSRYNVANGQQNGVTNNSKRRKLYLPNQQQSNSGGAANLLPPPIKPRSTAPPPSSPPVPSLTPPSFSQTGDNASGSYYVDPQLSLGSGGSLPLDIVGLKANNNSNLPDVATATKFTYPAKRRIIGNYEVLHESDDSFSTSATSGSGSASNSNLIGGNTTTTPPTVIGVLKTYVVRHVITDELALMRSIDYFKYTHYMNVYRRLTEQLPREFIKGDYDDEEVLPKLWPEETVLFSERDPSSGAMRHYVVSPRHFGTLHTYVIDKKKMDESEAKSIYKQVVRMMAYCHDRGVVVRDVKLRKFVFIDYTQREIRLNDLDELYVCQDRYVDTMQERHGCPAYVSPEIIDLSTNHYAGKPADVWGLGVLLYVLLVGRYPFYDTTPSGLFGKIRSAKFAISEQSNVSYELRCIIRCLLRKSPEERPSAQALLKLSWLTRLRDDQPQKFGGQSKSSTIGQRALLTTGQSGALTTGQTNSSVQSAVFDSADLGDDQCVPSVEPRFVATTTNTGDNTNNAPAILMFRDQELYADVY